jgi:RNA polymerase sigma-70 factor (ECF subfamily)
MLEDKLLIWKFKHGSKEAFRSLYEKYIDDLMSLATNLLNDASAAEDVVQNVFVSFVQSIENFHLRENLKGFLATCTANRSRDYIRKNMRHRNAMEKQSGQVKTIQSNPVQLLIHDEELERASTALAELPFEQREVVVLYLQGNIGFRQIAKMRNVSIRTIQSRYRYGLNKLRSMLNGEVRK